MPNRPAVVHHSYNGQFAIRQGKWKLVLGKTNELYDMDADAKETTNVAEKHPEVVTQLAALLASYQQSGRSTHKPEDDEGPENFVSELFDSGTLVYADDFEGEFNRDRWGAPSKGKQIKDGQLIVTPRFKSKEEAMEVLKRDHHLGLEPVVHLNGIPEQFVCHLRYKCEKKELETGRPSFQIGHHMIAFNYLKDGGHRIKLPDGPVFNEPDSKAKLNEWIDLIIEYKEGTIRIGVNGYAKTYTHERVTMDNVKDKHGPRFTWKGGSDCRIIFDAVRLWDCGKQ